MEVPINISDGFPRDDEIVKISEQTIHDVKKISPRVNAGNLGLEIGEVSREGGKKFLGLLHLRRVEKPAPDGIELQWFVVAPISLIQPK